MKAVVTEEGTFRYRRGKLVKIPDEWVGMKPDKNQIRSRPSKMIKKHRKDYKYFATNKNKRDRQLGKDLEYEMEET